MYILPMEYQRIHQDIMNLDQQIRLVTICDISGKIIFSDHRSGVKNLLTPEESKLSSKIGRGKYVLAEYEKIKRITMPLGDDIHLLYITAEPGADHDRIIQGVARIAGKILIKK